MSKCESILHMMPRLLNPRKAKKARVSYAFRLSGEDGGEFTLSVVDGECSFGQGIDPAATTLIECEDRVWIAIAEQRLKPWQALIRKQLKISGSKLAMVRFGGLFSGDPVADEVPSHLFKETVNERDYRSGRTSPAKKVMVLQASPRKKSGATEIMLNELIAGLAGAGAAVDVEYLAEADIKNCTGCYSCWKHTEGICVIKDDMAGILSKLLNCDLLVLATPLYSDVVPGKLKAFFDRSIPLLHPYIYNKSGRSRHPSRHAKLPNIAVISVCGFHEVSNFDCLIHWIEAVAENGHMPVVATLLRPHAHTLFSEVRFKAIDQVLDATRQAGKELGETGRVSKTIERAVAVPIISRAQFLAAGKSWWEIPDADVN